MHFFLSLCILGLQWLTHIMDLMPPLVSVSFMCKANSTCRPRLQQHRPDIILYLRPSTICAHRSHSQATHLHSIGAQSPLQHWCGPLCAITSWILMYLHHQKPAISRRYAFKKNPSSKIYFLSARHDIWAHRCKDRRFVDKSHKKKICNHSHLLIVLHPPYGELTKCSLIWKRFGQRLPNRADPDEEEQTRDVAGWHPCNYISSPRSAAMYAYFSQLCVSLFTLQTLLGSQSLNGAVMLPSVWASPCFYCLRWGREKCPTFPSAGLWWNSNWDAWYSTRAATIHVKWIIMLYRFTPRFHRCFSICGKKKRLKKKYIYPQMTRSKVSYI